MIANKMVDGRCWLFVVVGDAVVAVVADDFFETSIFCDPLHSVSITFVIVVAVFVVDAVVAVVVIHVVVAAAVVVASL